MDEIALQCDHRGAKEKIRARHKETGNTLNAERCTSCGSVLVGGVIANVDMEHHEEDKHLLGA